MVMIIKISQDFNKEIKFSWVIMEKFLEIDFFKNEAPNSCFKLGKFN